METKTIIQHAVKQKYSTISLMLLVILLTKCVGYQSTEIPQLPGNYRDISASALDEQHLYVAMPQTGIAAQSFTDGKTVWQLPDDQENYADYFNGDEFIMHLDDNVLYVNNENKIYALDASNGKVNWEIQLTDNMHAQFNMLSTATSLLVTDSLSGFLYLVDCPNGDVIWEYDLALLPGQKVLPLSISPARITLLIGSILGYDDFMSNRHLSVLAIPEKKLLWSVDLVPWTINAAYTTAAVQDSGKNIYAAVDNNIIVFDGNSGEILWQTYWVGVYDDLVLSEDRIVAIATHSIFVVDRFSGESLCRLGKAAYAGSILDLDGFNLYFWRHRVESHRRFPWQRKNDWIDESDIDIINIDSCKVSMSATVQGYLLAYDPVTSKGLIMPNRDIWPSIVQASDIYLSVD